MNNAKQRNPWLVAIVVIFAGVVFAANLFKVPPTMDLLFGSVQGMTTEAAGWLVSAMSISGIILALPAGGIMMKTGPRLLGIISLCCTLVGSLCGTFVNDFTLLLLTRIIEGIGFGLIGVIAPAIIAACFVPEKRGLPMAIWSLWFPLGLLFIFNASTLVVNFDVPSSWVNTWWLQNALLALALILWIFIVKVPETLPESDTEMGPKPSFFDAFKSAPAWCLALALMIFAIGTNSLMTYAPGFIQNNLGFSGPEANFYSSVPLVAGQVVGGIVMGIILNMFAKRRTTILVISMIMTLIAFVFVFEFTADTMLAFLICGGFVLQMAPATIYTLAPEAALSPQMIGPTMGFVIFGQNLGGLGPGIIGSVMANETFAAVGGYDWRVGTIILIVVGILGVLTSVVYALAKKRTA